MNHSPLDELTRLTAEASKSLSDSQLIMRDLIAHPALEEAASFEIEARLLQLILAYRLNGIDTLSKLLNIDQQLLYVLGIQPQHSMQMNMDRLTYALGSNDLKQILHALSKLVDHLLHIASRHQQQHESINQHRNKNKKSKGADLLLGMQKIIVQQNIFIPIINSCHENMKNILTLEKYGPVHDRIAGLRGALLQLQQTLLEGLAQANELYYQVNKTQSLNHSLEVLLEQAETVLKQMPSLFHPQPNFQLGQFAKKNDDKDEKLEQHASSKRTMPFFGR